jgi:ubiquitin-conjugating enzyme E2 D/E
MLSATLIEQDDFAKWSITIPGPEGSPYEGGIFIAELKFPDDYPFKRPHLSIITKLCHPELYAGGYFHLGTLGDMFSPAITPAQVIEELIGFLKDYPNVYNGGPDPELVKLCATDKEAYIEKVKEWTNKYAK